MEKVNKHRHASKSTVTKSGATTTHKRINSANAITDDGTMRQNSRQDTRPTSRNGDHVVSGRPKVSTGKPTAPNNFTARLKQERSKLPIFQHVTQIRQSLREHNVLLLTGETGSGKSTQVPQILEKESWCGPGTRIAVTQPRRVAAISLAARVAAEMGTVLGSKDKKSKVGYSVRFDTNYSPSTRVKYLTEGTLLQEMASDPSLNEYSAVIVDEVHERSLNVDVILGHLRDIVTGDFKGRKGRPLKVVIMSATLNVDKIFRFFAAGFAAKDSNLHAGLKDGSQIVEGLDARMDGQSGQQSGIDILNEDAANDSSTAPIISSEQPSTELLNTELRGAEESPKNLKRKRGETSALKDLVKNLELSRSTRNLPAETKETKESQSQEAVAVDVDDNDYTKPDIPGRDDVEILNVKGRLYRVTVSYVDSEIEKSDRPEQALQQIFNINYKERFPGDILVFLPGQDEIESLETKILQLREQLDPSTPQLEPLPLFAQLPPEQQARVFRSPPAKTRKVVLSTNIAETSLTIPGIRYVVDTGLFKEKRFRPDLGLDSLLTAEISRSSSMQRAGRAGREAPGKCFRIYTEDSWSQKIPETEPEIRRCDLARAFLGVVQTLGNIDRAIGFPYVDPPKASNVKQAIFQMLRHNALKQEGKITSDGKHMAHLPLSVPLSRILLTASTQDSECLEDAIDMIAGLSVERMFLEVKEEELREEVEDARKDVTVRGSDHLTLMMTVRRYVDEESDRVEWCKTRFVSHRSMRNAAQVRKQLRAHFRDRKFLASDVQPAAPTSSPDLSADGKNRLLKCILRGMLANAARKQHDVYQTVEMRQTASIHPSSVLSGLAINLRPEMVVYHELVFTAKNYMRVVSAVEEDWYSEMTE